MTYAATMNEPLPAVATGYAGFWRRFLAYIIDSIILFAVLSLFGVSGWPGDAEMKKIIEGTAQFNMNAYAITLVAWWIYGAVLESSPWQATLGKMALGISVADSEGRRLSFGRALARNVAKLVSDFTLMIGYVMAAFTSRKQALHDIMTGCVLIKRQI
jgi:uncharacterized RDD family membrane protein YckC